MQLDELSSWFARHHEETLEQWKRYLSFPSISADPAYLADCERCAGWYADRLRELGFTAELRPTATKPVVFATYRCDEADAPTVLFYGHYDVQPVDPLDAWETPPFEPTLRDGRLYARGAQDNKGQSFYFLRALACLVEHKALRYHITVVLEGEEETASDAFSNALPAWKEELRADILMVCDTSSLSLEYPTITMGLRGNIFVGIRLEGPAYDLHSGSFGGLVRNPATEMARLLASLHDHNGRIAIAGYHDDLADPTEQDKALADAAPCDWTALSHQVGVALDGGEKGISPAQRVGFRPTIEINGMQSGYNGKGGKTIIPAFATAKITSRMANGQDPHKALEKLIAHLKAHTPASMRLVIEASSVGGAALTLSADAPWIQHARHVLKPLAKKDVAFAWEGGSIPIVSTLAKLSGATPVLVGFGLEEDRIHAPNESFGLEQLRLGFLYVASFLSQSPPTP